MSAKPTVLILGGLPTAARHLTALLLPEHGDPLVSHVRIVDKYSIVPATTYLGSSFTEIIKNPLLQYQQANLLSTATVTKVFDPPEGWEPFSYVFDCTGDITFDRPNEIQRDQTARLAYSLGLESARRKVAAHVRLTHGFYETEKKPAEEKDDLKPIGSRGVWWHEAIRMLGGIPDLNLAVIRAATIYGPHNLTGLITPRLTMGRVYQHLNEEMKYLWSGDLRINTVHLEDIAGAMWAVAEWMKAVGRAKAIELAGESIGFRALENASLLEGLEGHLPKGSDPVVPLFNLVDDSDSTQESLGKAIAELFGIKFGFYGFIVNTKIKMDFDNMVEEINGKHVEAWTDICMKSDPPMINPILQAYIDGYMLTKSAVAYKGDKIKNVVGYKLKRPKLDTQTLKEVLVAFRAEGNWPNYQDTV
ncbi:hypothetical protein FRB94_007069 [Tulasnella sp. JGI-2019a]|nr:hypothetical protein FRB94_007069 [Tulasnella sp. JGI-2019a]KAG9016980.1 hypothetical protein FRB93_009510 [Tulasnella sp. JGI-2019a]KAG9040122.1 hypothetical protein FRB95_000051 [Tulasnella sp. JGI-2019a]